jgi:tripartite-type tricarboxylate transporter receptor subunit TctC
MSGLPYDPVKDFAPVRLVTSVPVVIVVGMESPLKSVTDLVAAAKANPGKLLFASPGNATVAHLAGEYFKKTAGITYTHMPYKGIAQALPDVISGRASFFITSLESAMPQIKSGQLRAIGVMSLKRAAQLPGVPTVAESGYAGFSADTWFGIAVPAGTPAPIVARLDAEISKVLDAPDVKERLNGRLDVGAAEFAALIKTDHDKWATVVTDIGIKAK